MFIIRSETDKHRAIEHIKTMPLVPVQFVNIDDYKKNRTSAQNRTFHKWVTIIAEYTGYTLEEVKDKVVLSIWEPVQRVIKVKTEEGLREYTLIERRSTASLSTEEFTKLLDAVIIVAHTLKLQLPMPDDYLER